MLLSRGNERGGAQLGGVTANHQRVVQEVAHGGLKRAFAVAQARRYSVWQRLVSDGR